MYERGVPRQYDVDGVVAPRDATGDCVYEGSCPVAWIPRVCLGDHQNTHVSPDRVAPRQPLLNLADEVGRAEDLLPEHRKIVVADGEARRQERVVGLLDPPVQDRDRRGAAGGT